MKAVIAMDSFKGSLSSAAAGSAAAAGVRLVFPEAETKVVPVADGGEGTMDVFAFQKGFRWVTAEVTGPLGEKTEVRYGILGNGVAVMEMAQAAGLVLVTPEKRDPMATTSRGVGEMILHAMDQGCREIILGLGGSATNDGGLGMLTALGVRFFNETGESVGDTGADMCRVARADLSDLDPRLYECRIRGACDVDNPLCGPRGASRIFGRQKGADDDTVRIMDEALGRYAKAMTEAGCADVAPEPGSGAAGGLGYALRVLPGSALESGAALLMDALGLADDLKGADLLITGEGRIDEQTAMDKCPSAVARLGKAAGVPVVALCGSVGEKAFFSSSSVIDAVFPVLSEPCTLTEAIMIIGWRNQSRIRLISLPNDKFGSE